MALSETTSSAISNLLIQPFANSPNKFFVTLASAPVYSGCKSRKKRHKSDTGGFPNAEEHNFHLFFDPFYRHRDRQTCNCGAGADHGYLDSEHARRKGRQGQSEP